MAALMVGVASATGAQDEIRRLDREWGEAVVRRDAAALNRLLADDYTLIEPSGEINDKAGEMAAVKSPAFDFVKVSYRTEGVSVVFAAGRATVTGLAVLEAALEGREITRRYWYTRTFARRRGRWQIVAAQMIALPEEGGGGGTAYPQKVAAMSGACSPAVRASHPSGPTSASSLRA